MHSLVLQGVLALLALQAVRNVKHHQTAQAPLPTCKLYEFLTLLMLHSYAELLCSYKYISFQASCGPRISQEQLELNLSVLSLILGMSRYTGQESILHIGGCALPAGEPAQAAA